MREKENYMEKINELFKKMLCNNDFQKFVKDNENKTIEEIAIEYDIDIDLVKKSYV